MSAKLFDPDTVPELLETCRKSPALQIEGNDERFNTVEEYLCKDLVRLQNWVRTQFLCVPRASWSVALDGLCSSSVLPSTEINLRHWNGKVALGAQNLAKKISSRTLSSLNDLNLRLACRVAAGSLNNHPVVLGVLVAAIEQAGGVAETLQFEGCLGNLVKNPSKLVQTEKVSMRNQHYAMHDAHTL